jgi:hypothetical protein
LKILIVKLPPFSCYIIALWSKYAYKIFTGKPEGKDALRMPMSRWEEHIKIGLREIVLEGMD